MRESKFKNYLMPCADADRAGGGKCWESPERRPTGWFVRRIPSHQNHSTRILVPKDKFIQWIDQQTEVDGWIV